MKLYPLFWWEGNSHFHIKPWTTDMMRHDELREQTCTALWLRKSMKSNQRVASSLFEMQIIVYTPKIGLLCLYMRSWYTTRPIAGFSCNSIDFALPGDDLLIVTALKVLQYSRFANHRLRLEYFGREGRQLCISSNTAMLHLRNQTRSVVDME